MRALRSGADASLTLLKRFEPLGLQASPRSVERVLDSPGSDRSPRATAGRPVIGKYATIEFKAAKEGIVQTFRASRSSIRSGPSTSDRRRRDRARRSNRHAPGRAWPRTMAPRAWKIDGRWIVTGMPSATPASQTSRAASSAPPN